MKALRPEVRVLGGAAVPVPLPWFEDLFAAGALGAMDAVAVHPYRSTPEGVERAHWDLARDDHDFRTGLVRGLPCSLAPGVDFPITPARRAASTSITSEWRAQVSVPAAPPTTFAEWQGQNFTAAEFTDPLLSDDLSAPAGDGVANLLRYAFGLKRGTPASLMLPRAGTVSISGAADLTLTYRRSIAASDLIFTPELNPGDLGSGAWTPGGVLHGPPVDHGDGTQTVTIRDPTPITPATPRRFLRRRVSRPWHLWRPGPEVFPKPSVAFAEVFPYREPNAELGHPRRHLSLQY